MKGEMQDLSQYAEISYGVSPQGRRFFSCFLPWPSTTKHTRTALTPKPGYRPLVKAAKLYQDYIIQSVIVAQIPRPWLRAGTEFEMDVITFGHRSDCDQYEGGLVDDFTKSGVWEDDKHLACRHARRVYIPKTQEKVLYIAAWETEAWVKPVEE